MEIFVLCLILSFLNFSVSVSLFMLAKLVAKLETHVGNCIVWNMEFNLMGKCQVTKPQVVVMIHSTLSSVKLELENMFPELSLWTWNQLQLVRFSLFSGTYSSIELPYFSIPYAAHFAVLGNQSHPPPNFLILYWVEIYPNNTI